LSRAAIQLGGDRIQGGLVELAQVGASGEVLAEQPVGVLVAATLPGATRITEVHLDAGVDRELGVLGHFLALIPGQRPAELLGQPGNGSGEGGADLLSFVPIRQRDQVR
jgi:hypothetical protein